MKTHKKKIILKTGICFFALGLIAFGAKTAVDYSAPYPVFHAVRSDTGRVQILDRTGKPLTFSYQNRWNTADNLPLHAFPEVLVEAFIASEDKRFFAHKGVDILAKGNALWQFLKTGNAHRGASTITEQVVRMLNPRPRNLWSKWIESLEALALERSTNKADILEFYVNQVPFSANRHGVVQAARYYYNRDIKTLNTKEFISLAVLIRAPSRFDLHKGQVQLEGSIRRVAQSMLASNRIDTASLDNLDLYSLTIDSADLPVPAFHFVDFVRKHSGQKNVNEATKLITTLDGTLQRFVTNALDSRLKSLAGKNIRNAAAIVIDNKTHEVLAWVSVGEQCAETNNTAAGCMIDMVSVPRQPGSALKPFLYGLALEKGWTSATVIDDAPYSDSIGKGIKNFRNYSNLYYGQVRLRAALGNSLNIPALHTINFVTPLAYLDRLHDAGFESLGKTADYYDDGLALGNGEVTLYELARAYVMLANQGTYAPLKVSFEHNTPFSPTRIYDSQVVSLLGNILSDPWARSLEFGRGSVLNLPTQTAVKTGTSTDYRDAWAMGYNHHYTVGIWMGNADYKPTDGITGSIGPSLVLRSIFNELTKNKDTRPLVFDQALEKKDICIDPAQDNLTDKPCPTYTEYFIAGKAEQAERQWAERSGTVNILRPSKNLEMAFNPRLPATAQAFEMRLANVADTDETDWRVNGQTYPRVSGSRFLWPVTRGKHVVQATVWRDGSILAKTPEIPFQVK